jgi:hypothetical protein
MAIARTSIAEAFTAEADGPVDSSASEEAWAPVEGGGAEDTGFIGAEDMPALEDMGSGNPDTRLLCAWG